jgi:hypothetical protein
MTIRRTQQGLFGNRLFIWTKQRSAGKHIPHTPIWVDWEHYHQNGVGFFTLTVGNPRVHYRWAFNAYFYYKGV